MGAGLGAGPLSVQLFPPQPAQGSMLRIRIELESEGERPVGTLAKKSLRFFHVGDLKTWEARAGVDQSHRGKTIPLYLRSGAKKRWIDVPVAKRKFPEERLTLPKGKVSPTKKEVLERIRGDRAKAKEAGLFLRETPFSGRLRLPCQGRLNHNFGKRRILNGIPKSPHGGEDISAPTGTPVYAAEAGVVRLVADMFYSGKTVFLDHGSGWMTTYFHLSEIDVQEGQELSQGDPLGKVGATGRVTGPHLHWGLQWLRSRLDPLELVDPELPSNSGASP